MNSKKHTYKELLKILLEKSNNNLNQLIRGESLIVPSEFGQDFASCLKKYIAQVVEVYKENPENIKEIEDPDYLENNAEFFAWIRAYFENIMEPIEETSFVKNLGNEEFKKLVVYTLENYVVYHSGEELVDGSLDSWTMDMINTMKKVLFTVAEMIVLRRLTKQRFLVRAKEIFSLEPAYCVILWEEISKYEDILWKCLMYKKYEKMENQLDTLLSYVMDDI